MDDFQSAEEVSWSKLVISLEGKAAYGCIFYKNIKPTNFFITLSLS